MNRPAPTFAASVPATGCSQFRFVASCSSGTFRLVVLVPTTLRNANGIGRHHLVTDE
jgi:hypothetical protein